MPGTDGKGRAALLSAGFHVVRVPPLIAGLQNCSLDFTDACGFRPNRSDLEAGAVGGAPSSPHPAGSVYGSSCQAQSHGVELGGKIYRVEYGSGRITLQKIQPRYRVNLLDPHVDPVDSWFLRLINAATATSSFGRLPAIRVRYGGGWGDKSEGGGGGVNHEIGVLASRKGRGDASGVWNHDISRFADSPRRPIAHKTSIGVAIWTSRRTLLRYT